MKNEKRQNYSLNGSFHTLEIKSEEMIPTDKNQVSNCIATRVNKEGTIATSVINPNNWMVMFLNLVILKMCLIQF